jgi:hypothetical protein
MNLERFIENVHRLLQAGYTSMSDKELSHFSLCDEPTITAGLKMKIEQLLDGRKVTGISRAWSVVDEAPESAPHLPLHKQPPAKKMKRIDLKLRYSGLRKALYFRFEAKKLASSGDYAGLVSREDGLGRFLRRVYGREDQAGGLLGYIQTESPEIHAERVRTALAADPKKYRVNASWTVWSWKSGPECCFRAVHSRERGSVIVIFYSFLLFRPVVNR